MNQSKDKTVLFRVSVSKQNGGFFHASNFITKLTSREELLPEDVKGISNKFFLADTERIEKVRHLIANEGFHQITKPHNMLNGITGVRYEFGLVIEDEYLQDVVSIQPYVLMKQYYKEVGLFAVILGSKPIFSL